MEKWLKFSVNLSDVDLASNSVKTILFGYFDLENLLQNYIKSNSYFITFPLSKYCSRSYLKYLEIFPFWTQKNYFLEKIVTLFIEHNNLKIDDSKQIVTIKVDTGEQFQMPLIHFQKYMPNIYSSFISNQINLKTSIKIHIKSVSYSCLSDYVSNILDPRFIMNKWKISYEQLLNQLDLSIALGCLEMAQYWYNCFLCMIPTIAGKIWFKIQILCRYHLFSFIPDLQDALTIKFEQFIMDPLFLHLNATELNDWLISPIIGVRNEFILYLAVLKWLNYNWFMRKEFADSLLYHIQFNSMSLIQLVSCFFPPIVAETSRIPSVRASLDLALYNIQMQIKICKFKRRYTCEEQLELALSTWIDDIEVSLREISRQNESKVYGIPIEADQTCQNELVQLKQMKEKNYRFNCKLKKMLNLFSPIQPNKIGQPLIIKTSINQESSEYVPLHHLKFKLCKNIQQSMLKVSPSVFSTKLPINFYELNTCECLFGLHNKQQKCTFGFGMFYNIDKLNENLNIDTFNFNDQEKYCIKLFALIKKPYRYTLAYSGLYFGKVLHQKQIQLNVEYMSLLALGSPLTGIGYKFIWRLDLGRHVYAPVNWYTFIPLPDLGNKKKQLWSVNSAAIDWQDKILLIGGRIYQQIFSDNFKINLINKIKSRKEFQMPSLIHSPVTACEDKLILAEQANVINSIDILPLTTSCYICNLIHKNVQKVEPMNQIRANFSAVKCTINNQEKVLVMGGEDQFGKLLKSIEMFDGEKWNKWTDLPKPLSGIACTFIPFYINKYFIQNRYFNTLWVLGGWSEKEPKSDDNARALNRHLSDSVYWFDMNKQKWHQYPVALPEPLAFASAAFHNECIYVAGGICTQTFDQKHILTPTTKCWLLDLSLGKWFEVFSLLQARSRISLLSIGNRLLAIGGADSDGWPTRHVEMIINNGLGWCREINVPVALAGQQVVTFKIQDLPEPNLAGREFTNKWQWRTEVLEKMIKQAQNQINNKFTININ